MIALEPERPIALDADAQAMIATFVAHVATIAERDRHCAVLAVPIEKLLLAAISGDDGAPAAWTVLYEIICEIVSQQRRARYAPDAYAFLDAFVRENRDLAHDRP